MINYFLTMNGNLTAKDLATFYNRYNCFKKTSTIFEEKIMPLVEKKIILVKDFTNGYITREKHNINIRLNPDNIIIVNGKIKCRNSVKYFVGFPTFFIC